MSAKLQSIFNVYLEGAGPSSTHSIGPQRAARAFLRRFAAPPASVRVTLYGSLAATGRGHCTDQTLLRTLAPVPAVVLFDNDRTDLPHPNTLLFEGFAPDGSLADSWTVCSVGGGSLQTPDGAVVDPIDSPANYPISNITDAIALCRARDIPFWSIPEDYETDLWSRLDLVWSHMEDTIQAGLNSSQIILPGTLELSRRAPIIHQRAQSRTGTARELGLLAAYALAVAEENAAGGQVVTAPSCGSAGVLPAVLFFYRNVRGLPLRRILEALATAGLFGASIRANATVSGAEAGCQAEIGSACSMAAAAAAQLAGASISQIEYAAEMAMEHNLGLTCDPVEGYVQIPCIERNMNAALRAVECASFALMTDGRHWISFDDVIQVMASTGRDLQAAYRETSAGGLASVWRRSIEASIGKRET